MKKRFSIFGILAIILCSCFMFFGCGEDLKDYTIRATVWYANYGTVEGSGVYQENSTCKIKATPKQDSTFLAWMKDNKVVSYESEYEFKVTNETSGNYVAIFTLPNLDLVTPKAIEFNSALQDITACSLVLKMGTNYDNLHELYNGEVTSEGQYIFQDVVLALPISNKIICEANFTINYTTVIEDEETEASTTTKTYFEIELQDLITDSLQLQIPAGFSGTASITVAFENFTVIRPDTEPEEPAE